MFDKIGATDISLWVNHCGFKTEFVNLWNYHIICSDHQFTCFMWRCTLTLMHYFRIRCTIAVDSMCKWKRSAGHAAYKYGLWILKPSHEISMNHSLTVLYLTGSALTRHRLSMAVPACFCFRHYSNTPVCSSEAIKSAMTQIDIYCVCATWENTPLKTFAERLA